MSTSIKFPTEHYIAMITRENDDLPLGYMTPNGTDKAAEKRIESVNGWVARNSSYYDRTTSQHEIRPQPTPAVMRNEPMAGFRLLDEIKRNSGWGSGNVKWRVEDPRGFELEITSPNLMKILECSVVDQGEILDCCMWAREGGVNVLVPVTSEDYLLATANTARIGKVASMRDIKRGDYAIMQNGFEGRYHGRMRMWSHSYSRANEPITVEHTIRHIFINDVTNSVHVTTSPKLSSIISGEEMSAREAEIGVSAPEIKKHFVSTHLGCYFGKVAPVIQPRKAVSVNIMDHLPSMPHRGSIVFHHGGKLYRSYQYHSSFNTNGIRGIEISQSDWDNGFMIRDTGVHYLRQPAQSVFQTSDLINAGVEFFMPVTTITMPDGTTKTVTH